MSVPLPKITRLPNARPADAPVVDAATDSQGLPARLAAWLALVCRMIPDVVAARVSYGIRPDGMYAALATWPVGTMMEADAVALAERARSGAEPLLMAPAANPSTVLIARALAGVPQCHATLVLKLPQPAEEQHDTLIRLIDWSAAWLQLVLSEWNAPRDQGRLELLNAALGAPDLRQAATTMAIRIASIAGADSASIGLVRGERVELLACSHSATIDPAASSNRALVAAMEEALDEVCAIAQPPLTCDAAVAGFAHARLRAQDGALAVCTLPLREAESTLGALTLSRHRGAVFTGGEVAALAMVAADLASVLRHKRDAEASLAERLGARLTTLRGAHRRGFRLATLLAGLLLVALACLDGTYRVAAPATLRGSIQRTMVAPIDGYVLEAPARAGDVVERGDVLALLDTQSLDFERRKWQAEHAEAEKTLRQALAKMDRAEAAIGKAQLGKAAAQLALVEEQIARARVTAPFDGMVISGDLSRAMGAPVSRGDVLFEIAPLDDYRIELELSERDVADVRIGQHGELALSAWSAAPLPFTIDKVLGVAEAENGRNVFKAEAVVSGDVSQLRPGMQGVARIDSGTRRLLWVWSHALVERVRMWLWWRVP